MTRTCTVCAIADQRRHASLLYPRDSYCAVAQPMHDRCAHIESLRRTRPLSLMLLSSFCCASTKHCHMRSPPQTVWTRADGQTPCVSSHGFVPSKSEACTSSTLCYTVGVGASVINAKLVDLCVPLSSSLGFRVSCTHLNPTPISRKFEYRQQALYLDNLEYKQCCSLSPRPQSEGPAQRQRKPPSPPTTSTMPSVRIYLILRFFLLARTRGGTAPCSCTKGIARRRYRGTPR